MPAARGLFHKAVGAERGAAHDHGMDRAVELAERAVELAGVGDVAELRELAVEEILAVQQQVEAEGADRTFIPAVDGSHPDLPGPRASGTARRPGSRCSSARTSTSGSCGRRPTRTAATSTRTGCGRASGGSFPPTRWRA